LLLRQNPIKADLGEVRLQAGIAIKRNQFNNVVVVKPAVNLYVEIVHAVQGYKAVALYALAEVNASLANGVGLKGQIQYLEI
jgi:hypothetical protein